MSGRTENRRLSDPIVEEVRAVREAVDEDVGHDLKKLADRGRLGSGVSVREGLGRPG